MPGDLLDRDDLIRGINAAVSSGLTGRRLAEVSGVPPVSALRGLRDLPDSGIVTSTQVGRSHIYTLNREHATWPAIKIMLLSARTMRDPIYLLPGLHSMTVPSTVARTWPDRMQCRQESLLPTPYAVVSGSGLLANPMPLQT